MHLHYALYCKNMSKILIIHDTFLYRWGGERLVLLIAKALQADIASWLFSSGSYDLQEQGFDGKIIPLMPTFFLHEFCWLPKKLAFIFKNWLRHFGLRYAFRYNTAHLAKDYDTIIFSGDCLTALRHFTDKKILYYCHTIPRYLFDQKQAYEDKVPKTILYFYRFFTRIFEKEYLKNIKKINCILTNSKNTQKRILDYTGCHATILYPPVDTAFFTPSEKNTQQASYYLSFARLSEIKRVDLIVRAFQKLPEENLIITYGKNDPEKQCIMNLSHDYPNITLLQSPTDEALKNLIRGAKATIYIPRDEDFGMSPIESMACGTPVIGVNEGGLKETILDGITGILMDTCTTDDIMTAVQNIKTHTIQRDDCVRKAYEFSLEKFTSELKNYL